MLPKSFRLTEKYDYGTVRRFGRTISSPFFVVSIFKDEKNIDGQTRVGIIITNKIDKRATERNRLKRMVNRYLYENFARFGKGYLIVFVVKSSMIGKKYEEVSFEFDKVLSKISFA